MGFVVNCTSTCQSRSHRHTAIESTGAQATEARSGNVSRLTNEAEEELAPVL